MNTSLSEDTQETTLEEPIIDSIVSDRQTKELMVVCSKLRYVLLPISMTGNDFRQWDLWGPLFFPIAFAAFADATSLTLLLIYVGIALIAANARAMGTKASFLQVISFMGYSLAPLTIALIIAVVTEVWSWYGAVLLVVGTILAMYAAIKFLVEMADKGKKLLLTYPVVVFYLVLGWFTFLVKVI